MLLAIMEILIEIGLITKNIFIQVKDDLCSITAIFLPKVWV